jgi:hypothetical protein
MIFAGMDFANLDVHSSILTDPAASLSIRARSDLQNHVFSGHHRMAVANRRKWARINEAGAESATLPKRLETRNSLFVPTCRSGDGHLLLMSWQLKADGTLTRLADSGTGAEDIGKAHCLGHSSERRFRATNRRERLGGLLHQVQGKDA